MGIELAKFHVEGLFGQYAHSLDFRLHAQRVGQARVAIMVGPNGIGKTTIINMIEGMLSLDFELFRRTPFRSACLELSNGDTLSISDVPGQIGLTVQFNDNIAQVHRIQPGPASDFEIGNVENLRSTADPVLSAVSFQKVDTHRSLALQDSERDRASDENQRATHRGAHGKLPRRVREGGDLSNKVRMFVREAQIDYRKFFSSSSPELFPRILKRLNDPVGSKTSPQELLARLTSIKSTEAEMARFGLAMNATEVDQLVSLLEGDDQNSKTEPALAVLEVFLESLESKHAERQLIAYRLEKFEMLLARFFVGKSVKIDYESGLKITTSVGDSITETQLSSGEYHLLYMFITALVSTRNGTAIAIDEPELSLHISWQRNLIGALADCSSGASPLFIFATHSPSISSEYMDSWIELKEATTNG